MQAVGMVGFTEGDTGGLDAVDKLAWVVDAKVTALGGSVLPG